MLLRSRWHKATRARFARRTQLRLVLRRERSSLPSRHGVLLPALSCELGCPRKVRAALVPQTKDLGAADSRRALWCWSCAREGVLLSQREPAQVAIRSCSPRSAAHGMRDPTISCQLPALKGSEIESVGQTFSLFRATHWIDTPNGSGTRCSRAASRRIARSSSALRLLTVGPVVSKS